jgi:hypothetical protein
MGLGKVMLISINEFFLNSSTLGRLVLRPLSHINENWELIWDEEKQEYEPEEESYAELLNQLIKKLACIEPPSKYHKNEDYLAEYVRANLNWNLNKVGGRWIGEDYHVILEQGGFHDINLANLKLAAAGRIKAAIKRGQLHFDDMEQSHQKILAYVLAIILYHQT